MYSHENELSNKKVFSCLLNRVNEGDEVTLAVPQYLRHPSSGCRHRWRRRQTISAQSRWRLSVDFSVSDSRPWVRCLYSVFCSWFSQNISEELAICLNEWMNLFAWQNNSQSSRNAEAR